MSLDDPLHRRKPDAGPLELGAKKSLKDLEKPAAVRHIKPCPIVIDEKGLLPVRENAPEMDARQSLASWLRSTLSRFRSTRLSVHCLHSRFGFFHRSPQ